MTYEIYQKIVSKDNYFTDWDNENLSKISELVKASIYNRYMVKAEVFQRDSFECQNEHCKKTKTELTLHHVKFKKNGGQDKTKNCITLCSTCHKAFHRAKIELTFKDINSLPVHMRGKSFKLSVTDEFNWKKLKVEMKKVRKSLKGNYRAVSWEEISVLLKWFFEQYEN